MPMIANRMSRMLSAAAVVLAVVLLPDALHAQQSGHTPQQLEGVGVDEHLGEHVPRDLVFRNEEGKPVPLGTYLDGETPVLLTMVYHSCPMLCNLLLDGLTTQTLKPMSWTPGDEFEIVTVSFNHREGPEIARKRKAEYVEALGRPEAADGWHFLTGDEETISQLAEAVGFSFNWIEEKQQYAHPAALMFLSGEGKISRYLYGLETEPRNARNALVEASDGKVGSVLDQAVLYCFQYDPNENSYVANAFNIMKLGATLTVLLIGLGLFILWRREHRNLSEMEAKDRQAGWNQQLHELTDA